MRKTFTIIALALTLSGFAQNHSRSTGDNYPDTFHDKLISVEVGPRAKQLMQLYDSILNWELQAGTVRLVSKSDDFEYVDQIIRNCTDYKRYGNYWYQTNFRTWIYDDNKHLIQYISHFGFDTTELVKYQYDDRGNTIKMQKWQKLNSDTLRLTDSYEQTFNEQNLLVEKLTFYDLLLTPRFYLTRYTYYDDFRLESAITQIKTTADWANQKKVDYTYNDADNSVTSVNSLWNGADWAISYRDIDKYSQSGKHTSRLTQNYNEGIYINGNQHFWNYDVNGGLINYFAKTWKDNAWVDVYRQNCTNDSRGNLIHSVEEEFADSKWKIYWEVWETHDENSFLMGHSDLIYAQPENLFDSTHYYYKTTLGLPEKQASIKIYPNPVSSNFAIDIPAEAANSAEITLYTISGQKVRTLSAFERTHNIADLPRGIYIIKVNSKEWTLEKKIVKI